jgi:hypothetical protein
MSYVFSPPSNISFAGQGGSWNTTPWEQKTSNSGHNGTTVFCYGGVGTTGTDGIFRFNATTGVVTFEVNTGQTAGQPQAWSQHGTVFPGYPGSQPSSLSSDGDTLTANNIVHMWAAHSGAVFLQGYFTFNSSWVATSGPTVTSITRNESTNLITVLHTGTLTSSDVNHTISNVSSSITNLQTITNGSTFTASSANGTHVIQINDEIISYFIYNTTSSRTTMSSDNNLVVTFPTTDNAWLSNFSALNSGTLTPYISYSETKTAIRLAVMDYTMWITFNLSYNVTQEGFSVLTQIYDWRSANSSNNYAHVYSSTLQWVYPEATFESTGSADTLITLPTNEIVTSFNWNFASVGAPVTTTSNGGGKRRYPIISTNLFDRQRSIYSIGLTHKDDTLF